MTTKAYINYRGEKIEVKVLSTFRGADGIMANVEAVTGYPFYSYDVQSQGETHGAWNCNGYRVRADFVMVEDVHPVDEAQEIERWLDSLTPSQRDFVTWVASDDEVDTGLNTGQVYRPASNDGDIPF